MTGFVNAPRFNRCLNCWCRIYPNHRLGPRLLCFRPDCWSVSRVWEPKTEWGKLRKAERDEARGKVQKAPVTNSVTKDMEERLDLISRCFSAVVGWFSGILRGRS